MAKDPANDRAALRLTPVQRRLAAELAPKLARELLLDSPNPRTVHIAANDAAFLEKLALAASARETDGATRNSYRHIAAAAKSAAEKARVEKARTTGPILQFKVTLLGPRPAIWRRIQVPSGTLDDLHGHLQMAMGWENCHLHQFLIGGERYDDLELLDDGFEDDVECIDSKGTELANLFAKVRVPFRFRYEYDFGDGWEHEVAFEGTLAREDGARYPRCLEGARSCPPEDVGGVGAYEELLRALKNPRAKDRDELLEWVGGYFDPEGFDAERTTKAMRRGLPDWRGTP